MIDLKSEQWDNLPDAYNQGADISPGTVKLLGPPGGAGTSFDCTKIAVSPNLAHRIQLITVFEHQFYQLSAGDVCRYPTGEALFKELLTTVHFVSHSPQSN